MILACLGYFLRADSNIFRLTKFKFQACKNLTDEGVPLQAAQSGLYEPTFRLSCWEIKLRVGGYAVGLDSLR